MLSHIFELFMQVPQPLARTQGGFGIGLSMVRSLVEMHGGTVTATSPGVGRGSEFVVRLPLAGASGDATELPAETAPVAARGIVLVEDNDDSRLMLGELLRLSGHDVREAADGVQGVELILRHRPDIALVDIGLPGLDGYQVAEKVRAEPIANSIVLVALTGYGQPEDRRRALAAGFDAHLVKPVKPQDLARVLGDIDATSAAT
jgi:CheY-like chemotaxis protein